MTCLVCKHKLDMLTVICPFTFLSGIQEPTEDGFAPAVSHVIELVQRAVQLPLWMAGFCCLFGSHGKRGDFNSEKPQQAY